MGDIIQVLIIIGIIIFALVKQVVKASEEAKQKQAQTPMPKNHKELEDIEVEDELPEPYFSYDYNLPHTKGITKETSIKQTEKPKAPTLPYEEADEKQEFDIHSTEEVRRAIIWSEILNKKY